MPSLPRAILFDLDGTLADTAPDLAAALNRVRAEHGLDPAPYDVLRPVASAGARGLIEAAFHIRPGDGDYEELKERFLNHYRQALAVESALFDGVPALLEALQSQGIRWGVVTNKISRFTEPLIGQIGLQNASCVVSGDTTPHSKPHPAPLLEAARLLGLPPSKCWYVGDDLRDIQAGKAAGMATVAAAWGYCGHAEPKTWNADMLVERPLAVLDLLKNTGA